MQLLDCRRLTGPNLIWDRPGAVLDIAVDEPLRDRVAADWQAHARRMLDAVGWGDERTRVHPVTGGISLAISAPVDALYAATGIGEWAWEATAAQHGGEPAQALSDASRRLSAEIDTEAKPALLALQAAAADHGLAFASDDDYVSIGQGCGSRVWPVAELPTPATVPWRRLHDIPVGLVTGTNGKTTTVRLAAGIARTGGFHAGVSSTDWIAVDDRIVDRGDYSGPGGARTVLRDPSVEVAVLETARGGLLRRGLGVQRADAAVITNISADHVGDFGCRSLAELLQVKWTVSRALASGGRLVLNADDRLLAARGSRWPGRITWFGLDQTRMHLSNDADSEVWTVRAGTIGVWRAGGWTDICAVTDVPVTLGGAAAHNVANALAAAALCSGIGLVDAAIAAGLRSVQPASNPGRTDLMDIDGRLVVLDFAHNPAAVEAVLAFARRLPGARRLVAFAEAGDRPDDLLRDLAGAVWSIAPDRVMLSELAAYRRGRESGEVVDILRRALIAEGARNDQIEIHDHELDTVRAALRWSAPGDVLVLLILSEREAVYDHLRSLGAG